MSANLAALEQAIAKIAKHCTGLRSTLLDVGLEDEVRAAHDLEDQLMARLEALRAEAAGAPDA